jgi:hypothetical protein
MAEACRAACCGKMQAPQVHAVQRHPSDRPPSDKPQPPTSTPTPRKPPPQSNEYVFSMLVWHERLLYDEETWAAGERLMSRFPSVSNGLRTLLGLNKPSP